MGMKNEKEKKEIKETEGCALFGTGYDPKEAECQVCEKDYPSDYKRCKELTLAKGRKDATSATVETKKTDKKEVTKKTDKEVKTKTGKQVEKKTKATKVVKKSPVESKTLQYVERKVKQGKGLKGTSEQKILILFNRGLGKKITPLLKKGIPYGDWYRLVHWPERTIMERLGLVKYIDKKGVKTVMLG
jgi:hypothetical protein